jgi:hypothetical protein
MKKIEGTELVERLIGYWSPRHLVAIGALELVPDPVDGSRLVLDALFQARGERWPDFDEPMFRVKISFDEVGELCLNGFGSRSTQIMGFDIKYIGDRGMERLNFEVEDYEDNRIHFFCNGIRILSASPESNPL